MIRTRRAALTAEILNNARVMVTVIKRLHRGHHITITLNEDHSRIEHMFVSEVARELLNAHGISTITVGSHRRKHRHQVKMGVIYERDGTLTKDSLDSVLATPALFRQAMAPLMAQFKNGIYPHVERRLVARR